MDRRLNRFMVAALLVLLLQMLLAQWLAPPRPERVPGKPQRAGQAGQDAAGKQQRKERPQQADGQAAGVPVGEVQAEQPLVEQPAGRARKHPPRTVYLGSADPASPYRMAVVLTSRGGAVERIDLNGSKYRDQQNFSGYLGDWTSVPGSKGLKLAAVLPGTPLARAGARRGDVITALAGQAVSSREVLEGMLARLSPQQEVDLTVQRGGKPTTLRPTLGRWPVSVVREEPGSQASLLTTLAQVDDRSLAPGELELADLRLRSDHWELLPGATQDEAAFRYVVPAWGLEVVKRYRLASAQDAAGSAGGEQPYHLLLRVEIRNVGKRPRRVAYRLDGPAGLAYEPWNLSKINPHGVFGSAGVRDVVVAFRTNGRFRHTLVPCLSIVADEVDGLPWSNDPLVYLGVDSQYFAAVLIPQTNDPEAVLYTEAQPILAGPRPEKRAHHMLANTSCRLTSRLVELRPQDPPLTDEYALFAGPKSPPVLAQYGLDELICYGWYPMFAKPLVVVLHFFYSLVGNYGLAIMMLTVLVRSCLFPLSRKQALNAQKMQELQPEMKRLAELYKDDPLARSKATQELWRKHKVNPFGGCLPVLIQLPIFIGLYRALSLDIELRGAPLISEGFPWCKNLAAPDMLFRWQGILPEFLTDPVSGWLGPTFNLLPCVTIALFLWQQKMFMPPPTDEQSAMQAKVMRFMTVFMGILFFKVPAGLCTYFIASSLWSIAERKLLPKKSPASEAAPAATKAPAAEGNGALARLRKARHRGRK
ncbi:MAG: YidC/Oxa1 family insertase periplasmic-domain containing protein [Pirellulales bacterium]|nr:YidC/Oxa1 family insertase periplasmic-domain containing protein [Pirellulales bacterium]